MFTSASRLWGIVLSPGVKYWLSRNCSYFLTLTLKGRHCSPCCLCFQSVVHLARIPELEVCTPCDVFLRQWRLFLRQWRLFLRPWRLFLRPWRLFLRQWRLFLRPWRLFLRQWRLFLRLWRLFLKEIKIKYYITLTTGKP